jgi:hypothetical protein
VTDLLDQPTQPATPVVTDDEGNVLPTHWHAVAAPEGVMTGDKRMFGQGALGSRPLPLPFKYVDMTGQGHDGAQTAGQITNVERRPGYVYAQGTYDLGSPVGREAARQSLKQQNRFVSVDLTDVDAEHVAGPNVDPDDLLSVLMDEDGYDLIHSANIACITQCSIPAFYQAVVTPADQELDLSGIPTAGQLGHPLGLVSGAAMARPEVPPVEWFDNPKLDRPTHLTVTDDGRVFGHLATWDQPHVGLAGRVYAPRSTSAYAYYRTGVTRALAEDGATVDVPTGVLTCGTGHADTRLGHRPAAEHYDHTGAGVADVAAGEDRYGIWLAGAIRPGATDNQVRTLRASDVSGDWRTIGGRLELVAALVVNVPGFPIPRALAAAAVEDDAAAYESGRPRWGEVDGQQVSLVAAGVLHNDPVRAALHKLAQRLADQDAKVSGLLALVDAAGLRAQAADKLGSRIAAAG